MTLLRGQMQKLQASMVLEPNTDGADPAGPVIGKVEVKLRRQGHPQRRPGRPQRRRGGWVFFRRLWDSIRLFFYGLFN
ncbi:hypothetical protein ACPA9J_34405 [Pseudomonas aeruginosa]